MTSLQAQETTTASSLSEAQVPTRLGLPLSPSSTTIIFTSSILSSESTLTASSTSSPISTVGSSDFLEPTSIDGFGQDSLSTANPSSTAGISSFNQYGTATQGNKALHDASLAVIIGSITLGLVAVLIPFTLLWYLIIRHRKKAKRAERELRNPWDKESRVSIQVGVESDSVDGSAVISGEERNSRTTTGSFNPWNMVVTRSFLRGSTTQSPAASQITGTSNPPPPYGNGSIVQASERGSLGVPSTTQTEGSRNSMFLYHDSGFRDIRTLAIPFQQPSPSPLRVSEQLESGNAVQTATSGMTSASAARLLPSVMTVQYPFTPTNDDELEVQRGDKLHIAGVFDDGWCLCGTEDGRRGVVPLACFGVSHCIGASDVEPAGAENRSGDGAPDALWSDRGQRLGREIGEERVNQIEGEGGKERVKRSPRISSHSIMIAKTSASSQIS